jgi:hypothetical protein
LTIPEPLNTVVLKRPHQHARNGFKTSERVSEPGSRRNFTSIFIKIIEFNKLPADAKVVYPSVHAVGEHFKEAFYAVIELACLRRVNAP